VSFTKTLTVRNIGSFFRKKYLNQLVAAQGIHHFAIKKPVWFIPWLLAHHFKYLYSRMQRMIDIYYKISQKMEKIAQKN
jgi:hypothetical protein